MSHVMLEDVAGLKAEYPERVHFILGNHELAELTDYPIKKNRQMLNLLFRLGQERMYGPAAPRVREAMAAFLRSCPLAVRLPEGILVTHSLPEKVDRQGFDKTIFDRAFDDGEFQEQGAVFQLVWGRDYRAENARAFADLVGGKRPHQRPRAVQRGLPGAQSDASHPGLLRREGVLRDPAAGSAAEPGGGRRADQAVGLMVSSALAKPVPHGVRGRK